jgi:toxin ParE1/3/4
LANRETYKVTRSAQAERDLDALFDFLMASYANLGDDVERAFDRATGRVTRIKADLRALGRTPHQGTLRTKMMPGLRSVTTDRAIFYFTVDDDASLVRVLAVFFGGQDHQREMLKRLRKLK